MTRPIITDVWATGSNRTSTPTNDQYTNGWKGFPDVPDAKIQNFIDNRQDKVLKQICNEGILFWDAGETYNINAIVSYIGILYQNLTGINTSDSPDIDTTNWIKWTIEQATTTEFGSSIFDKNFIYGFIPSSNVTTPDEDIDITMGKALCRDLSTIVSLDTAVTALSMPTLLGSALANSTTYHLFRYKKNDDTDQWYLSTSVTPTIPDIKSINAFRKVFSFITATDGDLIHFNSIDKLGKLCIRYASEIIDYNGSPSNTTTITFSVPVITPYVTNVLFHYLAISVSTELWGFIDKASTYISKFSVEVDNRRATGQITECATFDRTISLVKITGTSLSSIQIGTFGYDDYRLNY